MTVLPPLSLLDRAMTRSGSACAGSLGAVVERAVQLDGQGISRFWVAEHHGVPGIAGSAPAVLMAAIAAATSSLRVGSGGIMLPNHQPLVVAEQAATLDQLHPGRIDLALGRSLGFTPAIRAALGTERDGDTAFANDLGEVVAYLEGTADITSRPRLTMRIPIFVLASRRGAAIAARTGLGVVLGGPVLTDGRRAQAAIDRYRSSFSPSEGFERPHVTIAVNAMVADTDTQARDLLLPEAWAIAQSRTRGDFPPQEPVSTVEVQPMTERQRGLVRDHVDAAVHGSPARVRARLADLAATTGADGILLTGSTYGLGEQSHSDRLLAGLADR